MPTLDEVTVALRAIEPQLFKQSESTEAALNLEDGIRGVLKLIAEHGDRWISLDQARRYLAARSENYVKAWARNGGLRSRRLANGRIQLSLDSVLRFRENYEAMTAIDAGHPITDEEALYLQRPLEYPRPASWPSPRKPPDPAP